jgi:hypothetical protein
MSVCLKKICVPLMLVLLFPFSTYAEQSGKPLVEKLQGGSIAIDISLRGCDEDAKKYCEVLEANPNQVFRCLLAYEDHLSEQCKQGILEVAMTMNIAAAAIEYSVGACEADADKHCLDVEPGEGRLVSCIKANESKVSKECITALKETGLWEMGQ